MGIDIHLQMLISPKNPFVGRFFGKAVAYSDMTPQYQELAQ
jgi:hypothetical protein